MPPPSKVIGLRLPTALKQQLADIASQQNTTMSVLTRGLIVTFLKKNRSKTHATANN